MPPAAAEDETVRAEEMQAASTSFRFARAGFSLSAPVQRELALPYGGRIIVAGGLDANGRSAAGVFALAPATGRLTALGSVPQAFHDAAGAIVGGKLLVLGGGPETGTNAVQSFDLRSRRGRMIAHLPLALSDLSAATIGSSIYVVGGFDGVSPQRAIYETSNGRTFRVVGHLPVGLRYPAVTSNGKALVIAGGVSSAGPVSTVYRFDATTRKVRVLAHLPVPLGHASAFALGNTVYVAGGRDRNDRALRAEYAVDALHGRVHKLAPLPSPVADAGVAELGGNVWLIGGWNGHTLNNVLEGRFVQRRQRTLGATKTGRPNVYAATAPGDFSAAVRGVKERVYVPNSRSGTVTVIDPKTFRIIRRLRVGLYDQHITPSWDLRRLYVNNTAGNSLTVINPRSGRATGTIPVTDPYNLYFTPDGSSAIVVVESYHRLDFRDPHTWALQASVDLPVAGPNHLDFSADGSYLLISAEFSGHVVKVDLASRR